MFSFERCDPILRLNLVRLYFFSFQSGMAQALHAEKKSLFLSHLAARLVLELAS